MMRHVNVATTAPVAQSIGRGVTRSLYRSLLQEARKIDVATVSKVLLPIPRKLQVACGLDAALYVPNGVKYQDLVQKAFRAHKPGEPGNPLLAFEALNMFRAHAKTVEGLIGAATKEHEGLVAALAAANPDPAQYWARPLRKEPVAVAASAASTSTSSSSAAAGALTDSAEPKGRLSEARASNKISDNGGNNTSNSSSNSLAPAAASGGALREYARRKPTTVRDLYAPEPILRGKRALATAKDTSLQPRVGMGLVAHPLSSAHIDRRVILLVDSNPQTTTGLVLDMFYTYPLSHGNPMFPEVFWGHEVYNGGYCHVDFSMPPTANVSVLHTLPPPSDAGTNSAYNARWLSWALRNKVEHTTAPGHHERLCKPVIVGGGSDESPTLYYSKVEALPYLASLVPGQPRSSVRVYWGCMRWSTTQLATEIGNGHWIPVEVSPRFFGAYPVIRSPAGDASSSSSPYATSAAAAGGRHAPPGPSIHHQVVDTFPTEEMLRESKDLRTKLLGADVVPPQTFPPDQPVCRREALWDQIMLALGGEYRAIVGSVNPFLTRSSSSHHHHGGGGGSGGASAAAVREALARGGVAPAGLIESREAAVAVGEIDDDDDDDDEDEDGTGVTRDRDTDDDDDDGNDNGGGDRPK